MDCRLRIHPLKRWSSRVILVAAVLASLSPWAGATDGIDELKADLEKPWTELVIARFLNAGTVVRYGVCFKRTGDGVQMATWKREGGKDHTGVPMELPAAEMTPIQEHLLVHYRAALVSDDLSETLAKLPAQERAEFEKVIRSKGAISVCGPGFARIEIRVTLGERAKTYANDYGKEGWDAFDGWLRAQEQAASHGNPVAPPRSD